MVGLHYDSLLAKVIATGADRPEALARLSRGLEELTVLGPATNRTFLRDAIATPAFAEGRATTGLIAETWPTGWSQDSADLRLARRLAAIVGWMRVPPSAAQISPWARLPGFRTLAPSGRAGVTHFSVASEQAAVETTVTGGPERFVVTGADGDLTLEARLENGVLVAVLDDVSYHFLYVADGRRVAIRARSVQALFEVRPVVEAALDAAVHAKAGDGSGIIAPMPGLIADIMVAVGEDVEAGQTVAVLESMKLFTDLKAIFAGRVAQVAARRGATVSANALIVAIDLLKA